MSVATRLTLTTIILLLGAALVGATALVGLNSLKRHFDGAHDRYAELQSLYEIGHRASMMRTMINGGQTDQLSLQPHLSTALHRIERLQAKSEGDAQLAATINDIRTRFDQFTAYTNDRHDQRAAAGLMNAVLGQIAGAAGDAKQQIISDREQASVELRTATIAVITIFAVTILIGFMAGVRQYRSIMKPVRELDGAVSQLSAAQFDVQIREHGDREFRRLIRQFNAMSAEIHRLHQTMHEEIERKSQQLVRSERLASVGYLAAGIAHEINNPLGIIAGYAESTIKRIEGASDEKESQATVSRAENALRIISDEAFRCRLITNELLELARPGDLSMERLAPAAIARRAASLLKALPIAQNREIVVCVNDDADETEILGNESQLLQVMINLIKNGLEACEPGGRVLITIHRAARSHYITVEDNGCGMDADQLNHAFEPFYTDKPQRGMATMPGTGLGLSIAHSIIDRHGGALSCTSEGPGCGSAFTIELPILVVAESLIHAGA